MLEIHSIDFAYKKQAKTIQNVSLTINSGEFLAIAGRNGSGKTTLTRLIMALIKPTKGNIVFDGKDTKKYTPADMAQNIGYVFQNPDRQIFRDTVFTEVSYGPEQLGYSAKQITDFVETSLYRTGLSKFAGKDPLTLSKGQKQRLALASALAMNQKMLILDEPSSGQDAIERQQLMDLLQSLHCEGKTILLITHDMDLISNYTERAIVMDKGMKVFDDKPTTLFNDFKRLNAWGLAEPTVLRVSRALTSLGINKTFDKAELVTQLSEKIRRNCRA